MTTARRGFSKLTCAVIAGALLLVLILGVWAYFSFFYQSRGISRITGIPLKIALPDCVHSADQVKSVSFHKDTNGESIKDVTYVCNNQIFSHEYNDTGVFQGSIEWTFEPTR